MDRPSPDDQDPPSPRSGKTGPTATPQSQSQRKGTGTQSKPVGQVTLINKGYETEKALYLDSILLLPTFQTITWNAVSILLNCRHIA
jgi:hypothetical protein